MFANPDRELLRADIVRCLRARAGSRISDMPLPGYQDSDILSELDAMFRDGEVSFVTRTEGISRCRSSTKWTLKGDSSSKPTTPDGIDHIEVGRPYLRDEDVVVARAATPPLRDLVNPEKLIGAVVRMYLDGPRGEPRVEDAHDYLLWISDILAGQHMGLENAAALLVSQGGGQ